MQHCAKISKVYDRPSVLWQGSTQAQQLEKLSGEGSSLSGLGATHVLPLRICSGGLMSIIWASICLQVCGAMLPSSPVAHEHHAPMLQICDVVRFTDTGVH